MATIKRNVYIGSNSIISSLGVGTANNCSNIGAYTSNLSSYCNTPACTIERDEIDCKVVEGFSFIEQISILAIKNVITESNLSLSDNRTLLIISTTKGEIESINQDIERTYLWSFAKKIEKYFNCHNRAHIVSNACVSGVAAIVLGARLIEQNEYDNIIVLGVDTISEFVVSGFNSFRSISQTLCKPYDNQRDGLTIGEGCGALLLTNNRELSDSDIRVLGGGISNDANHISGPSRTGDGLFFALEKAMKEAGLSSEEIDYINTHGTGTPFNDEMESKALNLASLTNVPCNSLKPYIGHTLGASGVIETIFVVEQMKRGQVYGVKGYSENGVPYQLNISNTHRDININSAIKCASGFGGTNAAIVLSKLDREVEKAYKEIDIKEIASITIEKQYDIEFAESIKREYKGLNDSNLKFFKMDNLSKLGYVASCKLLKGIDLTDISQSRVGVILANRSSSLDTDIKHQSIVDAKLEEGASPAVFVYTLANIVAAEISIKHKFQGELMFFVNENKCMDYLYNYSKDLINRDICDAVLYGWCELLQNDYNLELKLIKR